MAPRPLYTVYAVYTLILAKSDCCDEEYGEMLSNADIGLPYLYLLYTTDLCVLIAVVGIVTNREHLKAVFARSVIEFGEWVAISCS